MAQSIPDINRITSFNHKSSYGLPDPSSPSNKPLSDSYEGNGNNLVQDHIHLLPTWQELEQNLDWQITHKKLDFTFNTKELAGATKLARMMRDRKVYHQAYDICPLRRRRSGSSYSKSCEPQRNLPKDESSQTDFYINQAGLSYLQPLAKDNTNHVRRSSSLSYKNPYSNQPSDPYGVDSYRQNHSILNSDLSPEKKINSPGEDYHSLTIPSEKNTPDSFYKDIGRVSRIDHSNLSTRDSAGPPPSRFSKEKYSVGQIQNFGKVNGSFETNEDQSSKRNLNPKILIIDAGTGHDSNRHVDMKPDIKNQRDTAHSNLEYIAISERPTKKEEYNHHHDKLLEEKSSDDEQKSEVAKNKKSVVKEKKQADNNSIRGINNPRFKFIGDSEANKDKALDISKMFNEEDPENKPYSNRNIIDAKKLLTPQLMETLLAYPDFVILEGELTKYKPGVHFSYVKRWVQITKNELRYYKNRLKANTLETTPILIIPFKDIKAVYRVNLKLPKQIKREGASKGVQKIEPPLYHFEVFTNNHPLPSPDELDATIHLDNSAINDKSLLFSPEYAFRENASKSRIVDSKTSLAPSTGYREISHLMPPPPLKKRNELSHVLSIPENCDYEEYSSNLFSGSLLNPKFGFKDKRAGTASSLLNNQREQSSALNSSRPGLVRKNPMQASQISEVKDKSGITAKKESEATYHYVKTIEDFASWTGRHKEWYTSEKRLLFCSVSKKEREIWLSIINWLIKASNS